MPMPWFTPSITRLLANDKQAPKPREDDDECKQAIETYLLVKRVLSKSTDYGKAKHEQARLDMLYACFARK